MAKGRLLAKKRKIDNNKKAYNKPKKKAKTLVLKPKTFNNFRDKYK